MSSHPKRWYFSAEDCDSNVNQQVYVRYEDGSPLVNPRTKVPFGCVYDLRPTSREALPHAIEVRYHINVVIEHTRHFKQRVKSGIYRRESDDYKVVRSGEGHKNKNLALQSCFKPT